MFEHRSNALPSRRLGRGQGLNYRGTRKREGGYLFGIHFKKRGSGNEKKEISPTKTMKNMKKRLRERYRTHRQDNRMEVKSVAGLERRIITRGRGSPVLK